MLFVKSANYSKKIALGFVLFMLACSGRGNVDLSKATKLTAEPVEAPKAPSTPINPLFNNAPGSSVSLKSLGTIDETGLSLVHDYDGDGIPNHDSSNPSQNRELNGGSNQWVADYPIIEASVVPPVTMKIQVLKFGQQNNDEIVSQINSDDYEEVKEKGTEKVHQNELNGRSTMIQDEYGSSTGNSTSAESSDSYESKGGISIMGFSLGGGGSGAQSRSESWSNKTAYSATKTTFPTIDFKNNLDRDAVSLKSDAAARNARKYRVDRTEKKKDEDRIEPNAGIVRVALYIKNLSANMPVRLTNILCTFMFEANDGKLIPVQSFRLRNEDYSLFSVNIYGGSEFGPYVIELPNLNTAEIERALQLGFNPKVFIVDYDMTHVPNSNYKNILTSYQGDNLKIVEENTKGRTALLKIKGPQMREMYRVAAFSISDESTTDDCAANGSEVAACPGISMRKALERVRDAAQVRGQWYYATNVEYQDYIFDFGDELPRMKSTSNGDQSKVYLRTVKTLGNVSNRVQCEDLAHPIAAPSSVAISMNINTIPVCKAKPFSKLSDAERQQFGVWVVFANGKFYTHSEYEKNPDGTLKKYQYNTVGGESSCPGGCNALIAHGIDGTVWVGDNFDWVYLTLEQFLFLKNKFGNNPLETGEILNFNTKWDLGDSNTKIFDPQFHSRYLGQAALGDRLEIMVNLQNTKFLDPKFHVDDSNGNLFIQNFSYSPKDINKNFAFNEAIDFEINLGVGDQPGDWGSITQPANGTDTESKNAYFVNNNGNGIKNCGKNLDYLTQQYKICVELPTNLPNANADGRVNIYLRPILQNAYRNNVWPRKHTEVNKFQGELANSYTHPASAIDLIHVSGEAVPSDKLLIAENDYRCEYSINTITTDANARTAHLNLSTPNCAGIPGGPTLTSHSIGLEVGVRATDLTASEIYFSVSQNTGTTPITNYFYDFNATLPAQSQQVLLVSNALPSSMDCANNTSPRRYGPTCFGLPPAIDNPYSFLTTNWFGGVDQTRNFQDASHLVKQDYLSNLANLLFPESSNNSRMRIAPWGTTGTPLSQINVIKNLASLSTPTATRAFSYQNRTLFLWETFDNPGGARAIFATIVNNETQAILLPVSQIQIDNTSNKPGYSPLLFEASQNGSNILISYGSTWLIPIISEVTTLVLPGQFSHGSALGMLKINLFDTGLPTEKSVFGPTEGWITSHRPTFGFDGDNVVGYSTIAFSWQNEYLFKAAWTDIVYYCPAIPTDSGPQAGHVGYYEEGDHCRVDCYDIPLQCAVFHGAHPNTIPKRSYTVDHPDDIRPKPFSAGQNSLILWKMSPNGGIGGTASKTTSLTGNWRLENFAVSANRTKGYVLFRDVNTNLINFGRSFDLTVFNDSSASEDVTFPNGLTSDGIKPESFGANTIARIAYLPNTNNKTIGVMVMEMGQPYAFYGISSASAIATGKLCTAAACASMKKYAPNEAEVLWLEDDDTIPNIRNLYAAQVRITSSQSVTFSAARLVATGAINAPEHLVASERAAIASWLEGNTVMARSYDKKIGLLGGGSQYVYVASPGSILLNRSSLNETGSFTVAETALTPGVLGTKLFQLNEREAFTLKYGLNNFFTAPLIERNYTATAKVLIK